MWNLSVCLDCGCPIDNNSVRTRPKNYCHECSKKRKNDAVKMFIARKNEMKERKV